MKFTKCKRNMINVTLLTMGLCLLTLIGDMTPIEMVLNIGGTLLLMVANEISQSSLYFAFDPIPTKKRKMRWHILSLIFDVIAICTLMYCSILTTIAVMLILSGFNMARRETPADPWDS